MTNQYGGRKLPTRVSVSNAISADTRKGRIVEKAVARDPTLDTPRGIVQQIGADDLN
jgi:hypothetical protein